jgi:hypothetical protein
VLPVTFALLDGVLWSAVDDKPKRVPGAELARVRWLRASDAVALTVDHYSDDWTQLAWVQILCRGSIEPVHAAVLAALADRYPVYRSKAPGGPLLRLEPERVVYWRSQ